jgi:hypothetical protein
VAISQALKDGKEEIDPEKRIEEVSSVTAL